MPGIHHQSSGPRRPLRPPATGARAWFISLFLAAGLIGASSAPAYGSSYEIEVVKSQRMLIIKNGDRIEKSFQVASGWGGKGDKRRIGDHHTPVGVYRIIKLKDSDKFHLFMQLNYPNVKDAYWGLKNKLITRTEFEAIVDAFRDGRVPPQNTGLGGAIGIHGLGEVTSDKIDIHSAADWTEGCIALTNEQIEELKRYVDVGTKVVIDE